MVHAPRLRGFHCLLAPSEGKRATEPITGLARTDVDASARPSVISQRGVKTVARGFLNKFLLKEGVSHRETNRVQDSFSNIRRILIVEINDRQNLQL